MLGLLGRHFGNSGVGSYGPWWRVTCASDKNPLGEERTRGTRGGAGFGSICNVLFLMFLNQSQGNYAEQKKSAMHYIISVL